MTAQPARSVVIREYTPADGDALRTLWLASGFRLLGDDDPGLARYAARNPGLFLVAVAGGTVVASAMGAWDGRRGWIYHVATDPGHRRQGLARLLVARVEAGLRAVGAPRVNVVVMDANDSGAAFWTALGYEVSGSRHLGKTLDPG